MSRARIALNRVQIVPLRRYIAGLNALSAEGLRLLSSGINGGCGDMRWWT